MGNHASTTQIFNNGGDANPTQNQSDTTSVPANFTANVNPSKFTGDRQVQLHLHEYISALSQMNSNNTLQDIDFFAHLQYMSGISVDNAQDIDDLEHTLSQTTVYQENRGIFSTLFSKAKTAIIGKVSTSAAFQKMIGAATSKITKVASSTLGEGTTNRLLDIMQQAAPHVQNFLQQSWNGEVTQEDSEPVNLPGVTSTNAMRNAGLLGTAGGGILPPWAVKNSLRSLRIRRGESSQEFKDAYLDYQDMYTPGSNSAPILETQQNKVGDHVYTCPAAAMLSETHQVPVSTVVDTIGTVLPAGYMSEYVDALAKANCAAVGASAPSIARRPALLVQNEIADLIPDKDWEAAAEHIRQDGTRYGVRVTSDESATVAAPDANVIQELINKTPLSIVPGLDVRSVENMKDLYNEYFKPGCNVIEATVADPSKIAIQDVGVPSYGTVSWLEVVDAEANCYSNNSQTVKPLYSKSGYFSVSQCAGLSSMTPNVDAPAQTATNIVTGDRGLLMLVLPCSFTVKPIYQEYDITFTFDLSLWNQFPRIAGGAIFEPGIIIPGSAEPEASDKRFLPAIRQGNSMLYQTSIALKTIRQGFLFGPKAWFGFGVFTNDIDGDEDRTQLASNLLALSILEGKAHYSVAGGAGSINYWVMNGKPFNEPLIKAIFTNTVDMLRTEHPLDISNFWSSQIATRFVPFMKAILDATDDDANILGVTGLWNTIRKSAIDEGKFMTIAMAREWIKSALLDMNSWMLWRSNVPFSDIKIESMPQVAWHLLAYARSMAIVTVYTQANNSTISSAMQNLSIMFSNRTLHPDSELSTQRRMLAAVANSRHSQQLGREYVTENLLLAVQGGHGKRVMNKK